MTADGHLLILLASVSLWSAGCGDDTGGGGGSGGAGSTASTGAGPAECQGGDVEDSFTADPELASSVDDCTVATATTAGSPPSYAVGLSCQSAGELAFTFSPTTPLAVPFPLQEGDSLTLESYQDDFPPNPTSWAFRTEEGQLLFAWVTGFSVEPPGAGLDWAAPLTLTSLDGVCPAGADDSERRAIVVESGTVNQTLVFSQQSGTIETEAGTYEVRVAYSTYNPDIVGGCNSCVGYAVVGPRP